MGKIVGVITALSCASCGHQFQHFWCPEKEPVVKCEKCGEPCHRVHSKQRNAQAPPTVVWEKKLPNGEIDYWHPPHESVAAPEGYQKRELYGAKEVREFAKQLNERERREFMAKESALYEIYSQQQSERNSDLRREARDMDNFHRELAEIAMKEAGQGGVNFNYDPGMFNGAWE